MIVNEWAGNDYGLNIKAVITGFNGSHMVMQKSCDIRHENEFVSFEDSEWKISYRQEALKDNDHAFDLNVRFDVVKGNLDEANTALKLCFSEWSVGNYVLMPAAVYNGNRFEARIMGYPPQLCNADDLKADIPVIISDVPRLNIHEGASEIQMLTRDMSTPAIGFFNNSKKKGFWLLTEQATVWGDSGIAITENSDRSKAEITVSAPGVRNDYRYTICNTKLKSDDRGACFKKGDAVNLRIRLYFFDCPDIAALFDYFVNIRKDITGEVILHHQIPFSSVWAIQETKYNEQNWEKEHGYYSIGMRENIYQDWQIGWIGGGIASYPLMFEGSALSKDRALRNLDFIFNGGQDSSGFFFGCGENGKWYGDCYSDPEKKWHLIRKSADALYFLIKQFMFLKKQEPGFKIPEKWSEGARKCTDAFVRLWERYGQFGQFVDTGSGDIIVGGSACGGIAPAGLALASEFFGSEAYLEVACQVAAYYYESFIKKGYTTGGPGEILQCPDSESVFGLLESYVVLYEITGDHSWIDKAKDTANQCMTWCVSYDYIFPKNSTFGKLDMHTAGSVYANVQNKHSAPGICTLSGDSLFKLFRATGDKKYLEQIAETAHNLPQYLSRDDRPILSKNDNIGVGDGSFRNMPAGWMCERVNMSDWLEPIGEIFYGSCWCEVSSMLTYTEIPGLYVQPDTGFICAIDHIDAEIVERGTGFVDVNISNPTGFSAEVKVFVEDSEKMCKPLGQNWLWGCNRVKLEPYSQTRVKFQSIKGGRMDEML
jgi:hypothetical protein